MPSQRTDLPAAVSLPHRDIPSREEPVMSKKPTKKRELWVETMCRILAPIERKTVRALGKRRANFFAHVYVDCMEIILQIDEVYPQDRRMSLVYHSAVGLMKETHWLNTLFLAGNYPLVNARLRFTWELIYRANFVETYKQTDPKKPPTPGSSIDEKAAWWGQYEQFLNWKNCLEPTLRKVLPVADQYEEVRVHYHNHLKNLHLYVHPSAYLADRLVRESALHAADNFDKEWAIDTLDAASVVFDLIWLAVLDFYPRAGDRLFAKGLRGHYPVVSDVLKGDKPQRRSKGNSGV
jgi:hypothetical protein